MLQYMKRWFFKQPPPDVNAMLEPEPHLTYLKALYEQLAKHCKYDPLHAQLTTVTVSYPNAETYVEELLLLSEWMRLRRDVRTVIEYKKINVRIDDYFVDSKHNDVPVKPWVLRVAEAFTIVERELITIHAESESLAEYYLRRASSLLEDGLTVGMYLRN